MTKNGLLPLHFKTETGEDYEKDTAERLVRTK